MRLPPVEKPFFSRKVRIFVRRIADDASGRFKNEKGELEAERTESIVRILS